MTSTPEAKPQFVTAEGGAADGSALDGSLADADAADGRATGASAVDGSAADRGAANDRAANGGAANDRAANSSAANSSAANSGAANGGAAERAGSNQAAGDRSAANRRAATTVAAGGDATAHGPAHPVRAPLATRTRVTRSHSLPKIRRTVPHTVSRVTMVAASPAADRAPSSAVTNRPATKAHAAAVTSTRTDTRVRTIPYATRTVYDSGLPRGVKRVRSAGAAGERTLRYLVTLTDGHETGRRLLSSRITRRPRQRIVVLGSQSRDRDDDQGTGGEPGWLRGMWGDQDDGDDWTGLCGALCLPWGRSAPALTDLSDRSDGRGETFVFVHRP
jgi:hypothetical protein